MFKKIIAPFQDVLLTRGLCVGCTFPLAKASIQVPMSNGKIMIQCKCKRRYSFDTETRTFKRMSLLEEQEYLKEIGSLQ